MLATESTFNLWDKLREEIRIYRFSGSNICDLAKELGMSEIRLYNISGEAKRPNRVNRSDFKRVLKAFRIPFREEVHDGRIVVVEDND